MTRLALAGKCGGLGASGSRTASPSGGSQDACQSHRAEAGAHRSQHFTTVIQFTLQFTNRNSFEVKQYARILGPVRLAQELHAEV